MPGFLITLLICLIAMTTPSTSETLYNDGSGSYGPGEQCTTQEKMIEALKDKFGEIPSIEMQFGGTRHILFISPSQKTYTVVVEWQDKWCINMFGKGVKRFVQDSDT